MKAILPAPPGGPEVLRLGETKEPLLGPGELLIAVKAAGVNRADLMQRDGVYPPPAGVSDILGLEVAGTVVNCGPRVRGWQVGDRAMALVAGGGYAEFVAAPAAQCIPVPESFSWAQAAATMEVMLTAWQSLRRRGGLRPGDRVLIHAAGSGVGTAAIQVARELGAGTVIATSRSAEKLEIPTRLGATALVVQDGTFSDSVLTLTDGAGADVILDLVGAAYLAENVRCLARGGRLILVGLVGGRRAELDLSALLPKQATISAMTVRGLSAAEKAELVASFTEWGLGRLSDGRLTPIVEREFPLAEAADAHRLLASNDVVGKVVLRVG